MGAARTPSPRAGSANRFARSLFRDLPPRYDTLANLLSFGQDRRWRATVVAHVTAAGPKRALDVACGPAGIALAVARRSDARVVGVDLSEEMLRRGVANVRAAGCSDRVDLLIARAEDLPFADTAFEAISFSYLMRYVDDPAATIAELARCLAPGGAIASLDFSVPGWAPARACWHVYTRWLLPLLGGLLGGRAWFRVGRFLGPSIRGHYDRHPLAEHVVAWQRAGLVDVRTRRMSFGGGLVMTARKAPATP